MVKRTEMVIPINAKKELTYDEKYRAVHGELVNSVFTNGSRTVRSVRYQYFDLRGRVFAGPTTGEPSD